MFILHFLSCSSDTQRLSKANEEEKKLLEAAAREAEENFGDVEVKDAILAQAHFYCRIGDIVRLRFVCILRILLSFEIVEWEK